MREASFLQYAIQPESEAQANCRGMLASKYSSVATFVTEPVVTSIQNSVQDWSAYAIFLPSGDQVSCW